MGRRGRGLMPQVRLHKPGKQGQERIDGRVFYVGRFGTPEANPGYIELMIQHGYLPGAAPAAAEPQQPPAPQPVAMPAGDEPVTSR